MNYFHVVIFSILLHTSSAAAIEPLVVELFHNSSNTELTGAQKRHLYENTIGYLSTCQQLDQIIGGEVSVEVEAERLQLLTQGDYLKISFGNRRPAFPISSAVQKVETIYVGFRSDGFPNLITENDSDVQLYAKCQGYYAILNYSCDQVLSDLLGLEINHEFCSQKL